MKAVASHDLAMPPEAYDWVGIGRSLDAHGNAVLPGLLTAEQCDALAALYPQEEGYRTRIVMARHGFGRGEYKYFAYPLPPLLDPVWDSSALLDDTTQAGKLLADFSGYRARPALSALLAWAAYWSVVLVAWRRSARHG